MLTSYSEMERKNSWSWGVDRKKIYRDQEAMLVREMRECKIV
jgi:hypothetical protein